MMPSWHQTDKGCPSREQAGDLNNVCLSQLGFRKLPLKDSLDAVTLAGQAKLTLSSRQVATLCRACNIVALRHFQVLPESVGTCGGLRACACVHVRVCVCVCA